MPRHGSPALANAPVPVSFTPLPPVGLLPVEEEHSSRESGTLGQDTGHLCRRKGPGDSWPRPMGRDRRTSPSSSQRFARAGGKNKNTHVRVTGSVRARSEREGAAGEPTARPRPAGPVVLPVHSCVLFPFQLLSPNCVYDGECRRLPSGLTGRGRRGGRVCVPGHAGLARRSGFWRSSGWGGDRGPPACQRGGHGGEPGALLTDSFLTQFPQNSSFP